MATQPEATIKTFHPFNCHVTLNANGSSRRFRREGNLTFQTLAKFKCLSADAIESFTAEVFGGGPSLPYSCLAYQLYGPMHWNPLTFAAVNR